MVASQRQKGRPKIELRSSITRPLVNTYAELVAMILL